MAAAAPVRIGERAHAMMYVAKRSTRWLSEHAQALLTYRPGQVVGQASGAIRDAWLLENARLCDEVERCRGEAAAFASMARTLTESLDIEDMGVRIVESLRPLFKATVASLGLLTADSSMRIVAWSGGTRERATRGKTLPPGEGLAGRAVIEGRPLTSADITNDATVALSAALRQTLLSLDARAGLSVPLRVKGRTIGALTVADKAGRIFSESQVALLETLADQAALGLEHARLYTDALQRQREAEALSTVTRALAESLDVKDVGERIVESARYLVGATFSRLRLLEPDGALRAAAWSSDGPDPLASGETLLAGVGVTGRAAAEVRPISSPDFLTGPAPGLERYREMYRALEGFDSRAILVVPLRVNGATIGTLTIGDKTGRTFLPDEVKLLETFADRAALALEKAQLYAAAERQRKEAEVMADLARSVNATLERGTVLQRAVEAARELCGSDVAQIALPDGDSGVLRISHAVGFHCPAHQAVRVVVGRGAGGLVLATRRPFRTANYAEDPGISGDFVDVALEEGITGAMVVPIMAGDDLHGLIYVANRLPRAFTEQDEAILLRLADHIAVAVANAELYRAASEHEGVLQALTHQLTTAQEAERKRLSQEIHDELGQALTAIKISLSLLSDDLGNREETVRARIDATASAVQGALQEVRRMASDLRPYGLDLLGLGPALRCHVDRFSTLTGIAVELSLEGQPGRLDPEAETLLYRVTQEALTNAARHAGATKVWCRLRHRESCVELTITDDGRGFDPEAVLRTVWKEGRLGLVGIKERVERMGGTLALAAEPGGGTRLTVELRRLRSGSTQVLSRSDVGA